MTQRCNVCGCGPIPIMGRASMVERPGFCFYVICDVPCKRTAEEWAAKEWAEHEESARADTDTETTHD